MQKIQGRCECGSVRYHCDAEPLLTAVCHCKSCQRTSGSAFSVVVAVPKGALVMDGAQPDAYRTVADSGAAVVRWFCSRCGSPIFSYAEIAPALEWIKTGTLDDTSWLQPQMNIWCDSAQAWVAMSEAIPSIPRNPPMGDATQG